MVGWPAGSDEIITILTRIDIVVEVEGGVELRKNKNLVKIFSFQF